jgi:hypothetical protein
MRKQMTGLKIVVLDCCRNNPFAGTRSWARSRSGGGGLAQVTEADLPEGTMLVFSGEPGQEVPDGTGDHSPFAEALLGEMKGSGQAPVLTVFTGVATKVKGRQKPWIKFDGTGRSLHAFSTVALMTRGVPVAVEVAEPDATMSEVEIERRAREMADKLEAEALGNKGGEGSMVRTDPVPTPAFPAGNPTVGPADGTTSVMARTTPSDSTGVGNSSTTMPSTAGGFPAVTATPPSTGMGFVNGQGMGMVWVPETECWVDQHELVQSVYEAITGTNPSKFENVKGPVETVSWTKAMEFCAKLTKREAELGKLPAGYKYTLPTDAQWSIFAAGTKLEDSVVRRFRPASVGSLRPNPLGLYDMMGNVWEWVYDDYNKEMNRGVSTAGLSGIDKSGKVVRGASFSADEPAMFQINLRAADLASTPHKTVGFRVVLSR